MSDKLSKTLQTQLQKKLIDQEKTLLERIVELKEDDPFLNPDHVNDNAAVDTDVREQMGHDTIEAQVLSLERKVELIRAALKKIMKGTPAYGICENCKNPIPVKRLEFLPEVRFCVDCEKKLVK